MFSNFKDFYKSANKLLKDEKYKILIYNQVANNIDIYNEFKNLLFEKDMEDLIELEIIENKEKSTGNKVVLLIKPINIFYSPKSKEDCKNIIEETILKGNILDDIIFYDKDIIIDKDIYSLNIDKNLSITSLDEYIKNGGFLTFVKILNELKQKEVYNRIINFNLKGNELIGFYNYNKWIDIKGIDTDERYIVFGDKNNTDKKNKCTLSKNPYIIIENLLIKGYALGAKNSYIYINSEYKDVIKKINTIINEIKESGLLGNNILGTDFCFDITINQKDDILCEDISKDKNLKLLKIDGSKNINDKEIFNYKNVYAKMYIGDVELIKEGVCLIEVTNYFMKFTKYASCGKCTPCREGTKRMFKILDRISKRESNLEELDTLDVLENTINDTSLCVLGTKVIYIKEDACVGCTACSRVCPVNAITGAVKKTHKIDPNKCIRCEACIFKCKFNAIAGGVIK